MASVNYIGDLTGPLLFILILFFLLKISCDTCPKLEYN